MSTDNGVLLAVGHQCSAEYCRLIDFLPFKCQHCEQKFCGEHYLPTAHKCGKYDETKHNRIAPSCPLCNTPVAIPPGQDPNVRMERHITDECSVMTGKAKSSSRPHCADTRCKKVLYAPIRCDSCKEQFCAQHRFPADHKCVAPAKAKDSMKPTLPTHIASDASARSAAALAAIKRSLAAKPSTTTTSAKTPNPQLTRATPPSAKPATTTASAKLSEEQSSRPSRPNPSSASTSSKSTSHNPFSKADRRARAERESRLKAMEERAKRGLLSEDEKAILAAERAAHAQDKDDCKVM